MEYTWKIEEGVKFGSEAIDVFGWINPDGKVIAKGTASIQDGTSNTLLLAETRDASASCADTNNSGVAGIVGLTIPFRHSRSSERVLATVTPHDGEIEASGRYQATMRFEGDLGSFEVWLDVVFEAQPERSTGESRG